MLNLKEGETFLIRVPQSFDVKKDLDGQTIDLTCTNHDGESRRGLEGLPFDFDCRNFSCCSLFASNKTVSEKQVVILERRIASDKLVVSDDQTVDGYISVKRKSEGETRNVASLTLPKRHDVEPVESILESLRKSSRRNLGKQVETVQEGSRHESPRKNKRKK